MKEFYRQTVKEVLDRVESSEAGLTRLDSEHQDVLFETMMNACMGDDFDVDALLGELDTAFDNLAQ